MGGENSGWTREKFTGKDLKDGGTHIVKEFQIWGVPGESGKKRKGTNHVVTLGGLTGIQQWGSLP